MTTPAIRFYQRYPNLWAAISQHHHTNADQIQQVTDHLENGHFQHYIRFVLHLPTAEYLYLSDNITEVSGLSVDHFLSNGLEALGQIAHPRDTSIVGEIHRVAFNTLRGLSHKSRTSSYATFQYRVQHADGQHRWLEQTSFPMIFGPDGGLVVEWGLVTDITATKQNEDICWRFGYTAPDGRVHTQGGRYNENVLAFQETLTEREKEILVLLAQGCSSRNIAELLSISEQTVMSHRKNMLAKTQSANTAALVHMATRLGWMQTV